MSDGRTNGALVIETPSSARERGPVDATSPSRSCLTQRFSRQTPVHEASTCSRPCSAGPTLCASISSDPPPTSAPSPNPYVDPASGSLDGEKSEYSTTTPSHDGRWRPSVTSARIP